MLLAAMISHYLRELLAELKFLLLGRFWISSITTDEKTLSTGFHVEVKDIITQASLIYEWGAGCSTLLADNANIPIYSVEHHAQYAANLSKLCKHKFSIINVRSLGFPTGPFGRPLSFAPIIAYRHNEYCAIRSHPAGNKYDLFIVDGRCRLHCLLSALIYFRTLYAEQEDSYDPVIILDDANRVEYSIPRSMQSISSLSANQRVRILRPALCEDIDSVIIDLTMTINSLPTRKQFL